MITFTHEEKLLLRWLVAESESRMDKSDKDTLLMKLDKMLQEDGVTFHIERVVPPGLA